MFAASSIAQQNDIRTKIDAAAWRGGIGYRATYRAHGASARGSRQNKTDAHRIASSLGLCNARTHKRARATSEHHARGMRGHQRTAQAARLFALARRQ